MMSPLIAVLCSMLLAIDTDLSTAFSAPRTSPVSSRRGGGVGERSSILPRLHSSAPVVAESSASPVSAYETLGVEESKLALGITPEEVLENIGTREFLVNKFAADITKFSREDAEREVDKFLMDGEMLDLYIKYQQRKKEDPDWVPEYAERDDSPLGQATRFFSEYGVYIILAFVVADYARAYFGKANSDAFPVAALFDSIRDVTLA